MNQPETLAYVLSELLSRGIDQVILSPGSRNAPLVLAMRSSRRFVIHVVVDERSAGFIALGLAQQLRKPVLMVCTSGTAVLNYGPSLAEAYYQGIPLIAITADRPPEWIDRGEGQCIRQNQVFANYVKSSYTIDIHRESEEISKLNVLGITLLLSASVDGFAGPVHLNYPFREPLYRWELPKLNDILATNAIRESTQLSVDSLNIYHAQIAEASRILVVAGQLQPDSELQWSLSKFALQPNVIVMTEHHSNLSDEKYCCCIDRLIMNMEPDFIDTMAPEVVITIGRNIISRKLKAWLRRSKARHWQLEDSADEIDVFGHLESCLRCAPATFFASYQYEAVCSADWKLKFLSMNRANTNLATEFFQRSAWSDLKAVKYIHEIVPARSSLQMGNSSVVRYFLLNEKRDDIIYYSNRGVAGIDGCMSTAVGASSANNEITTAVIGDISFLYDSNAFWNDLDLSRLRVIVINNSGGGIFRIIEGSKELPEEIMSTNFEAYHQRSAKDIAAMYKKPYSSASNEIELEAGCKWLYDQQECAILEVFTDRHLNPKVLKEFFNYCNVNKEYES